MRLDRTACAGTILVLFVIALLFASFPTVSPTSSAENLQTDYVRYVKTNNIQRGSLEIEVLDNDNDNKVENASVVGEIELGSRVTNRSGNTDANGKFIIENLENGAYSYDFIINENFSAPGYERIEENGNFIIENGKVTTLTLRLNYNPFDVALAENSGALERGWTPHLLSQTYEYRMNTDFPGYKSNVKQLGGYNDYFATASRSTSGSGYNFTYYDPYRNQNVTFYSSYFNAHDYSTMVQVTDRWFYANGSTFIDYDSSGNQVWANQFNQNYTASNGFEIALDSTLKNVTYRPNIIHTDSHYEYRMYGYLTTGGVRIRRYAIPYWLSFHSRSDLGSGVVVPTQNFTISCSEYVHLNSIDYYRNNGSFVRTDTTDYVLAPWGDNQTTVMAENHNGYNGSVKLSLEFDNGITATLGQSELHFSSPTSTTLTLKPNENTHGSPHSATIRACDSNNRLVVGTPSRPARTYELNLNTENRPAPITIQYLLSSGTSYISVGVNSLYTGALQGASVELRYSNGATFASGTTGSGGTVTFTPSPWPLNTNLTVTASSSGYFTGTGSVNTGEGGTHGVTVSLSKGDFTMACSRSGAAGVLPNGTQAWNSRGRVKTWVTWPQPGWLGGSVNLSGQIAFPDYFSGYIFGRYYMNPSGGETSGYDEVETEATARRPCTTSSGVRVFGTAGPPTNYQRLADVPYDVTLLPQ